VDANCAMLLLRRMQRWLTYTLVATALWGVWGTVSALVAREASPLVTQVVFTLSVEPAALALFLSPSWKRGANFGRGILWFRAMMQFFFAS
jgi:hypothetical protein